jgi:hypothetical protein
MKGRGAVGLLACLLGGPVLTAGEAPPETGFQPEVRVKRPTRLDWEFVARGFGTEGAAGAARLPADYESARQLYQLYVPRTYDAGRVWPLVVFVSPGDDPIGWRHWQKTCEDGELLFCAAYGAGNNCPAGQRLRLILDVLDDVRRHYRIDPAQTYAAGFAGGARTACALAYALPEYFGGVVAVSGAQPLPPLAYLRHRAQDRLSVALVTGATDFNRREVEEQQFAYLQEVGVRSRLWVVPELGHQLPEPAVLAEVQAWLAEDLGRRRVDATARPGLAASPDDVATDARLAARVVETAREELLLSDRTYRGVALLRGVVARWGRTEAADAARKLLTEIEADPERGRLLREQQGAEERRSLAAEARALEKSGDARAALRTWARLARAHPETPEGAKAAAEAKRLLRLLDNSPYLGLSTEGDTGIVKAVEARGPAERAGVQRGDRLVKLGASAVGSLGELRQAVQGLKPGDRVTLEVERGGKALTLTVEVGAVPSGN